MAYAGAMILLILCAFTIHSYHTNIHIGQGGEGTPPHAITITLRATLRHMLHILPVTPHCRQAVAAQYWSLRRTPLILCLATNTPATADVIDYITPLLHYACR